MSRLVELLQEGREREREQALFYRMLAGDADRSGHAEVAERLNELLADEQHHVSRLTARILELGGQPPDAPASAEAQGLKGWEPVARAREREEIRWYEAALSSVEDAPTRAVLEEILEAERHHEAELSGKWMSAAPSHQEETE